MAAFFMLMNGEVVNSEMVKELMLIFATSAFLLNP